MKNRRGLTQIELLVSTALLLIFLVAVWHVIRTLALSSSRTGRDAVELSLALRMSARFRDDARQALDAAVDPAKSTLRLTLAESIVQYRRSPEGRLERVDGEQIDSGPLVQALQFEFAAPSRLIRSRWICGDDPVDETIPREARLEERVLVLDTALRSAEAKAP